MCQNGSFYQRKTPQKKSPKTAQFSAAVMEEFHLGRGEALI